MKVKVYTAAKNEKGSMDLPKVFSEDVRPDLIKRAVEALQANARQPYGTDPEAGKKHSTKISRRRHNYRGSYGFGISRVPRKILSRRGTRMFWVGALAPGTVGGRRAHPPKASKVWAKKINIRERRKAIRSAIAATTVKDLVSERGHKLPQEYPFVMDDAFESMKKTGEVKKSLELLGLKDELTRAEGRTFRAGVSRLRGRKYRKRKGPLLVVSQDCDLIKSGNNIPGVDVVKVNELNAEMLAPGANPGRLTLFTASALTKLDKENLFTGNPRTRKPKAE